MPPQFIKSCSRTVGMAAGMLLVLAAPVTAQAAAPQAAQQPSGMHNNPSGAMETTPRLMERDTALDEAVMASLHYCQEHYPSCADITRKSAGVLVFPSIVKADVIVGGSGGKGALIEHGKITGYYDIGSASVGLQAGVENASQIYAFPTEKSMAALKQGHAHWRVGDTEGITLMAADIDVRSVTGKTTVFIFDSRGLHAGVSLDLFDVWKTGSARPGKMPS